MHCYNVTSSDLLAEFCDHIKKSAEKANPGLGSRVNMLTDFRTIDELSKFVKNSFHCTTPGGESAIRNDYNGSIMATGYALNPEDIHESESPDYKMPILHGQVLLVRRDGVYAKQAPAIAVAFVNNKLPGHDHYINTEFLEHKGKVRYHITQKGNPDGVLFPTLPRKQTVSCEYNF